MLFGRGPFMNVKHWRGVSNEIIFDRLAHTGHRYGRTTSGYRHFRCCAARSPRGRLQSALQAGILLQALTFKVKYPDWPSKGRPIIT